MKERKPNKCFNPLFSFVYGVYHISKKHLEQSRYNMANWPQARTSQTLSQNRPYFL